MGTVLGRVLVIDDDPFMLKVICELLERAGYHVLTQASPIGATQVIVRERVDAAVIDWKLPDVQGDEVIRLLRTWEQVRDLPVLLITGAPPENLAHVSQQLPGVRVLSKDSLRKQLVSVLGTVVGSGNTLRGLVPVNGNEGDAGAASARAKERDLVAQLLAKLAGIAPLARQVWDDAMRGELARVEGLVRTLELLAGQARLLALGEVASLVQALADTLSALPSNGKAIPRDVRRAVEGGIGAFSALGQAGDGTFAVPPEPLIGALQKARTALSP